MNKLILSLLLSFSAIFCFAQYTPYPTIQIRSSPSTIIDDKGANQFRKGLVNGRFADTILANAEGHIAFYPGAQIVCGDTIWLRNSTATKWINQGPSGSLVSVVSILNDSTILICNINSCDTFVVHISGRITEITILSDTTVQVCGSDILGAENITNGSFTGSATGWALGTLWAYGTDNIDHNFGSTASSFQGGTLTQNGTYTVSVDVGGTTGTVVLALDGGTSQSFNAASGTSTFTGTWTSQQGLKINILPSNDFDGTIDNVSVKAVLPNCDTLQITSTNFPIDDTIFVLTPLRAAGDDTIAITQAGPTYRGSDSGYLSTAGYDTFYYKVDTLLHTAANNQDILQFGKNGIITAWDTLDIVCYGLINPGDVIWTGLPGLIYDVTSANYRIDCKPYTSPNTQITLNAADATNPRIDVIAVDSSGNAVYIPGTAAATPVTPQVDPSYQVYLTSILVPALATIAPIDTAKIYDDNDPVPVNWTGPLTATGTTINAANNIAGTVYRGAVSINVTNINNGDLITFTNNTTTQLTSYQAVVLYLKLKQTIPAAANLRLRWFNGATAVSNFVNLAFTKNNLTSFQAISVPLSSFTFTNTLVDRLQIGYTSNNATVNLGFYLDFIYLQNGVTPSPVSGTIVAYNFLTHVKNNGIDSIKLGGTGTENTTLNLNGKVVSFQNGGNTFLSMTPASFTSLIGGNDGTAVTSIVTSGDLVGNNVSFDINSQTGSGGVEIFGDAQAKTIDYTADRHLITGRFEEAQGAALAAANNLTLGTLGNTFSVTGNTQINAITTANWQAGSVVRFIFTGTPTVKNNTAGGAGTATMLLAGGVDYTAAANDVLSLEYDGTNWHETARKTTSGATTQTLQQTFNTEVGGSVLTKIDSIMAGAFSLRVYGSAAALNTFQSINSSSGTGIYGQSSSGVGGDFFSTSGNGVSGSSSSSTGGVFVSTTGKAASFTVVPATTNTITEINRYARSSSGTAANGIGVSEDYYVQAVTGGTVRAGFASYKWVDATFASRTAQYDLALVNNTTINTVMSAYASGVVGIGIAASYTATRLNVVDNAVGAANMVDLTSTSTAAASNAQKLLNVSLSGTNATSSQTTYGIYSSNAHAGTSSVNVGVYGTATNGTNTNTGVLGSADYAGVNGVTTSGYGTLGTATTGIGAYGTSVSGLYAVGGSHSGNGAGVYGASVDGLGGYFISYPTSTNTVVNVLKVERDVSSGTPANGVGGSINYVVQSSSGAQQTSNTLVSIWTDATNATRTSQFIITGVNSGTTANKLVIEGDGRIYGTGLHNAAGAVTGTTNQYIASGTYTPTLTNVTNIAASTAYSCQWIRVGNVVTVSGKVDIDVTLGIASELGMSLPIASAMTAEENAGGTASSAAAASLVSAIRADATNDRAAFVFTAVSVSNDSYFFEFTYLIK